jgi:hypothetical protein
MICNEKKLIYQFTGYKDNKNKKQLSGNYPSIVSCVLFR